MEVLDFLYSINDTVYINSTVPSKQTLLPIHLYITTDLLLVITQYVNLPIFIREKSS